MGRGKHMTHKEDRVSISTKIPVSTWLDLTKKKPEVIFNAAKYIRDLILKDLKNGNRKQNKDRKQPVINLH